MRCAWKELLSILPIWCREEVDRQGRDSLMELRMRLGLPPELICRREKIRLSRTVSAEDLSYTVNTASRYSPWAAATAAKGYIAAPGGHRIGLCGEAVLQNGTMTGLHRLTSVCIRVAREIQGVAGRLAQDRGSVLILGCPGSGKTTLLRDLIRMRSEWENISVVDERGELFPPGFTAGPRTDVLTCCGKAEGVDMLLRTMSPNTIAVDEITAQEDCRVLLQAGWCGVNLLATAHAASREDLMHRPVYKPLAQSGLFDTLVILQSDRSWRTERMDG